MPLNKETKPNQTKPELEPYHQMQFSVNTLDTWGFFGGVLPLCKS